MNILNTGFSKYSDDDLYAKGTLIHGNLTSAPANTIYPTFGAMLTGIDVHRALFAADIAKGNAPGAADARVASRAALTLDLQTLAPLLEAVTPGDRASLALTGYDLHKLREHDATPTGIPQNVTVKPTGNPGEAKLHCDAVPHAVSYESRATLDLDAPVWVSGPTATKIRQLLFTGLERGKDWNFQIRAIGPNGPSPWSDVARMMVV